MVAIALLAGFLIWVFAVRGGGSPTSPGSRAGAVPVSLAGLRTLAAAVRSPIFWAGPQRGFSYELTKTSDGRVFVRYLPTGVAVGTDKPYLTIGTYPVHNAFAVTRRAARRTGSVSIPIGKGGFAFYAKKAPTNVYLAYPGSGYQVEVYHPSAARAQQLVALGRIRPVPPGSASTSSARAVTPARLKSLAAQLKHPVYWAGAESGVTYELTQTSGSDVYVRYLPHGVRIGVRSPYLTIGTYAVKNAFAVTRNRLRKPGTVRVAIGGGAIAFYRKAQPTNVYVAYPGVDLQIEVYDPSARRARGLVASGHIVPVS